MHSSPLLTNIPGLRTGFGNNRELVPSSLCTHWDTVPVKIQVHGTSVVEVTEKNQQCGDADAFFTSVPGIPLTVITADCVPILLARRDGKMIAVAHAGWRGMKDGVLAALWQQLQARGERPEDWVAAIGAHIRACCFEVSEELANDFVQQYSDLDATLVRPSHRHLDLNFLARVALKQIGITEIDHHSACTLCSKNQDGKYVFRSYRRGDRNSFQHSGMLILP
ncbi:peptidoglycan editing factor PgeF [Undibacterium sp. TJN19]|uniref:peptidoglycan editing factor PgeF n=1 Tax=Undibacterium sp. TJN19 TaxID=3413055 RepID=UPI003BF058E5